MDTETLHEINQIVTKAVTSAATTAVAQMREFHLDDMKVLGERMDMGFESVDRRFDAVDQRIDGLENKMNMGFESVDRRFDKLETRMERVENALATLLDEFKKHREEVTELKRQISELTLRVQVLEKQVASTVTS
jgi:predicted  nucleic acid-binding Zn-ribbon protein